MKVTQALFAKHVAVTPATVSGLVKNNIIDLSEGLDAARISYCQHLRKVAARHVDDTGESLVGNRAALTREQTKLTRLKRRHAEGDLISVADMRRDAHRAGTVVRDSFLALPARVSSLLIDLDDASISRVLTIEVKRTLTAVADAIDGNG